jgi:hypothetical protein
MYMMDIIQTFKIKFNEIVVRLKSVRGITIDMSWKNIIDTLNESKDTYLQEELYELRKSFVNEMNKLYCPRGQCFYSGSETYRSDIDVSIKNKWASQEILEQIKTCIKNVFSDIFKHNTERNARRFLDLNHYLSNFEITPWCLDECVLHVKNSGKTYYLSSKYNNIQRYYAFAYWKGQQQIFTKDIEASVLNLNRTIIETSAYNDSRKNMVPQFDDYKAYVRRYQQLTSSLQRYDCEFSEKGAPQKVIDDLTNAVSFITRYEDEGYATQGSFYFWVKLITDLPYHLLLDCIIEHICLANGHREDTLSFFKYMSRCMKTVMKLNDEKVSILFKNPWWENIAGYLVAKKNSTQDHDAFVKKYKDFMPSQEDLSTLLVNIMNSRNKDLDYNMDVAFPGGGVGSKKVRVLGRLRKVTKVGRKSMVTYQGKLISLSDARKLEKAIKK